MIDFTDNHGLFFDTPANGDAFPFRYSAGDDVVFRTSAADCPVSVAATTAGGRRSAADRALTYADYGKIIGQPRGARRRRDLVAALVGDARAARVARDGVDRHARHGAGTAGASFFDMRNANLQADEVVFAGLTRTRSGRCSPQRGMGYFAAAADGSDVNPVAGFTTPPDCAVDPCGTVSGTTTDSVTDAPISGVHWGSGHMS